MEKIAFTLLLLFLTCSSPIFSQDTTDSKKEGTISVSKGGDFEGVIVYEISFPGLNLDERTKALMPKEMKLYLKGDQQRLEMQQTTGVKSVTISDSKAQTSTILMDIMEKKMAMKVTKEDMEKELAKVKAPQIVYSDVTKTIAGYTCKKAELVQEDGKKSTIFYTEDIKMDPMSTASWNYQMPQLKGFPLEFEMDQKGTKMKMTAIKVSKELVPLNLFAIPEGYQEITRDQLQNSLKSSGSNSNSGNSGKH